VAGVGRDDFAGPGDDLGPTLVDAAEDLDAAVEALDLEAVFALAAAGFLRSSAAARDLPPLTAASLVGWDGFMTDGPSSAFLVSIFSLLPPIIFPLLLPSCLFASTRGVWTAISGMASAPGTDSLLFASSATVCFMAWTALLPFSSLKLVLRPAELSLLLTSVERRSIPLLGVLEKSGAEAMMLGEYRGLGGSTG
jgi:hypothetical protein